MYACMYVMGKCVYTVQQEIFKKSKVDEFFGSSTLTATE